MGLKLRPVDFATNIYHLNGKPLKLTSDHRHLFPIYNKPSTSKMLKFGRQTHKSTTLGFLLALNNLRFANYHSLYVAPTMKQVQTFTDDKLNSALSSPFVQKHYFNTKTKNQGGYKEFTNNSKIYLRSAFLSADSIRGISADFTAFDEVQDIVSDHIPVIEQCMSHSIAKWGHLKEYDHFIPPHIFNTKAYCGTPKSAENTMEGIWDQSTQNEWIIKCTHVGCGKYNLINELNIGDTCLICNKCGKPIHYENGDWVSMRPEGLVEGYRMPQIVLNWVNNEHAWKENVIKPMAMYSTEKVYNEVLALPYSAARHPLNKADMMSVCQQYEMWPEEPHPADLKGTFFAGIDWGKGDTASGTSYSILTISRVLYGKYQVLLIKKYSGRMSDPIAQVKDMLRIIDKYKCRLTIADYGDGRTSNAMMVQHLGPAHFAEMYEHGTAAKKIRWDSGKGHYIMNRTQVMTDFFMDIKNNKVEFFRFEEFKPHLSNFTGIYQEYSEQTRMTKYDHNVPDDAWHSYMFGRIAAMIINGDYAKYLQGGGE